MANILEKNNDCIVPPEDHQESPSLNNPIWLHQSNGYINKLDSNKDNIHFYLLNFLG